MPKNVRDFVWDLRKENLNNHDSATLLCHTDSVGTTENVIWNDSGTYAFPDGTPQAMTISSSSAQDAAAGTGTSIVLVDYLDTNYELQVATITLTGQTEVTIASDVRYVNRIRCVFSGSGQTNAGDIYAGTGTVTAGVPANIYLKVVAGDGLSRTGAYVVPANYYFLIGQTAISSYTSGKQMTIKLEVMADPTNTWLITTEYHVSQDTVIIPGGISKGIPPKTLIRYVASVDVGTADLSVIVGYTLIHSSEIGTSQT